MYISKSMGKMSSSDNWFSSTTVESRTSRRTVIVAVTVVAVWTAWIKSGCPIPMPSVPAIQVSVFSVGAWRSSPVLVAPAIFPVDAGPVGGCEIIYSKKENQKCGKFHHFLLTELRTVILSFIAEYSGILSGELWLCLPKASFQEINVWKFCSTCCWHL